MQIQFPSICSDVSLDCPSCLEEASLPSRCLISTYTSHTWECPNQFCLVLLRNSFIFSEQRCRICDNSLLRLFINRSIRSLALPFHPHQPFPAGGAHRFSFKWTIIIQITYERQEVYPPRKEYKKIYIYIYVYNFLYGTGDILFSYPSIPFLVFDTYPLKYNKRLITKACWECRGQIIPAFCILPFFFSQVIT